MFDCLEGREVREVSVENVQRPIAVVIPHLGCDASSDVVCEQWYAVIVIPTPPMLDTHHSHTLHWQSNCVQCSSVSPLITAGKILTGNIFQISKFPK